MPKLSTTNRFYVWMAACMLLINLGGFAPSWFLKHWFESPPLAMRTHIHGVIFSGWFVVLMIQVSLIARRKLARHRQLGRVSAGLAVAMVLSAFQLIHYRVRLYHTADAGLEGTMMVVWGNLALLSGFVVFVMLGYVFRKQSSMHKRFMILASIAMMPQALGRLGYLPSLRLLDGAANNLLYVFGGILILLGALWVNDRLSEGRIHTATAWGAPALLLLIIVGSIVIPLSPLGPALIQLLG